MELRLAQAASHHLREAHQRGFELADVGRVVVVGVLVADGFGADVGSDFGIEPAPGIFTASLAGEGQAPFSEAVSEIGFFEASQVPNFLDAESIQVSFHHFTDSGNFADIERSKEPGFFPRNDPEHAVGLGLGRGHFGDQAGGADPYRAVQTGVGLHALVQSVRGLEWGTVQAFGAGHVEVGLIDGGHFHLGRKCAEDFVNLLGTLAIALGVAVDKDCVGTHLGRGA